jgi:glycerol uptake facilitator-like aquaporin
VSQRAVWAELTGTSLLVYVVVGSGIAVERLGGDDVGRLFLHAVAVGLALAALISLLASTSGAHFNPVVSLAFWRRRALDARDAIGYLTGQMLGALLGMAAAVFSFGTGLSMASQRRDGWGRLLAEVVGTMVLVLLIVGLVGQGRSGWVPASAGAWVTTMVLASASTGFLNPAVTVARMFTDTYTGIAAANVPGFLLAQLAGAAVAVSLSTRLSSTPDPKGN